MARSGTSFSSSLFAAFTLAGIIMFVYLFAKRTRWSRRNLVAGLILGLLNFSNIYFYLRAHQVFPNNPTLVFSAMNIGVYYLGTQDGALCFTEKLAWVTSLESAIAIYAINVLVPP